ncbi:testis-expressed protein 10 homolog isoform X2 [Stegodyphus dumicola]|uniref:testis-expressed protein 10 homolog isoform X2 n=1 Tax=Stegodyphus dumicola TaxID=202533 RepID=UPI0015AFD0DB|nr:testis-expressed protein 10 homolog isoform X2 [Stegodyphus dumicola]
MGKSKKADFQKTKLRVGRILPKGTNVTNTSFKAKKIITRDQRLIKTINEKLKDTLSHVEHTNASKRCEALSKIKARVKQNAEDIVPDIFDILSKVIKVLYDTEPKARHEAISVIKEILETTTEMQIKCSFPLLTSNLICAMTSSDFEVRKDSLDLLSAMLETHPNLICHSFKVLYNLLDMVSSPSRRSKRQRALIVNVNNKLTSQDWRIKVLTQLRGFLRAVLASMNKLNENKDEQEVYWDGKTPLYLHVYAGGGLKPLDIEQLSSAESSLNFCWKPEAVKQFISDIIPVLIAIFTEEISEFASCLTKGYVLSVKAAESVQIILQIFAILGEWIKIIADADNELLPCLKTNLAIIYLYTGFVLESRYASEKNWKNMLIYLKEVFNLEYESRLNCIPMLLKIADNYLQLSKTNIETVDALVTGVCSIAKVHYLSPNRNLLFSFFRKLLLNPEYRNIQKASSLKFWFQVLFREMSEMMSSNYVDQKLLKDIKKICTLKFPTFMETLKRVRPNQMLQMLQYPNEDFQNTVIHLIIHMDELPSDFLQDLSELMSLNSSFSLRTAIRMIRCLYHRFSRKNVSPVDCVNFWKFLLNTACDTVFINETNCSEEENADFFSAWKPLQGIAPFDVVPSSAWKRHSAIFEICLECLSVFPDDEKIAVLTIYFLKTFLLSNSKLPVHCAIAVLRLNHKLLHSSCIPRNEDLESIVYDLMYSCLLYLSIMTHQVPKQDWHLHNINELEDSLYINRESVFELLKAMTNSLEAEGVTDDGLSSVLKILKYLIAKKLLLLEDAGEVIPLVRMILEVSSENIEKEPLWRDICTFFRFI